MIERFRPGAIVVIVALLLSALATVLLPAPAFVRLAGDVVEGARIFAALRCTLLALAVLVFAGEVVGHE